MVDNCERETHFAMVEPAVAKLPPWLSVEPAKAAAAEAFAVDASAVEYIVGAAVGLSFEY